MTALFDINAQLPLAFTSFNPAARPTGLVVVDIVNGFATVGAGALAPPVPDEQVSRMISETDRLARDFIRHDRPILAFLDTHAPGRPEPPYPAHCEKGSGEEELVPELKWLEGEWLATLVKKDCINGFIGAHNLDTGRNSVVSWVNGNRLHSVLVVGICTDVCVMDFVLTMLSARNHGMMPSLREVAVYEPGCATYDLPAEVAARLGFPPSATHPKGLTHHAGLYFMASRGARLVSAVE